MWGRFITPGAALLCAISLAVSGWALFTRFEDTNERRQAAQAQSAQYRKDQAKVWHAVLCYLETLTLKGDAPPARKAAALRAYDHLIELVHAPPCKLPSR